VEAIAGPRFDVEVMVETMVGVMLEMVGSLRGEPSSGGETILTFGFVLTYTDRRAATKTRTERNIAAVRESVAMEGKSKAKVTPRVSSGRARIQEKRQRSRLGVEVDG
jgi:hypothetical protein